jgi:hypothetical protein
VRDSSEGALFVGSCSPTIVSDAEPEDQDHLSEDEAKCSCDESPIHRFFLSDVTSGGYVFDLCASASPSFVICLGHHASSTQARLDGDDSDRVSACS